MDIFNIYSIIMDDQLYKLWKDHSYPGIGKFIPIAQKYFNLDNDTIKEFLQKQKSYQLKKRIVRHKKRIIVTTDKFKNLQIDLLDFQNLSKKNKGYNYALIIVDVFTRYAWMYPLKNKTKGEVNDILKEFLAENNDHKIRMITSDDGNEFTNSNVQKTFDDYDIGHYVIKNQDHRRLGVIDRFSKTIKDMIFKHFIENDTSTWIDYYKTAVYNYNHTPHASLCGLEPYRYIEDDDWYYKLQNCWVEKQKKLRNYKNNLKVGDTVRVALRKSLFEKSYTRTFGLDTHKITEIKGNNYVLDNGDVRRDYELQLVPEGSLNYSKKNNDYEGQQHVIRKSNRVARELGLSKRKDLDEKGNVILPKNLQPKNEKRREASLTK
jgi:ribosomal protein L21E